MTNEKKRTERQTDRQTTYIYIILSYYLFLGDLDQQNNKYFSDDFSSPEISFCYMVSFYALYTKEKKNTNNYEMSLFFIKLLC